MLNKKHYKAIAEIFAKAYRSVNDYSHTRDRMSALASLHELRFNLAAYFKLDNGRFGVKRFCDACFQETADAAEQGRGSRETRKGKPRLKGKDRRSRNPARK